VHDVISEDGNLRWRLDLLLLAESSDPPQINVGSLKAAGSRTESGVSFELKVDRVAKSEI
jgi:hypothetical protein